MYAIFETGGKQYTAAAGDTLYVEKLGVEAGEEVTFQNVLAVSANGETVFGAPYLEDAKVVAKVVKNGKGKKITVWTYRPKKDSQRKMGHRQPYTQVEILSVQRAGVPVEEAAPKAEAAEKAPKKASAKKAAPKKTEAPKAEKTAEEK